MSAPKAPNSTRAVHAGAPAVRANHTLAPSIAQTATYTFENTADLEQYMRGEDPDPEREEYGRYGNPTVREIQANGRAAQFIGVLLLVMAAMLLIDWVKKYKQHQR